MKFIIKLHDRQGMFYRSVEGPTHVWQPMKARAEQYDAAEALEIMQLICDLGVNDCLVVERID